jgi:hypothetical protein
MAKRSKSKSETAATSTEATNEAPKDVSLGPACMVVGIFIAAGFAILMTLAAVFLFGKQDKMAASALRQMLIPWVDESELSQADQDRIIGRLTELSNQMERGELDDRQLERVRTRAHQNPVLQWAVIEQTEAFAEGNSEFSDAEREQLSKISARLLQACAAYQVTMEDLGFLVQNLATQDSKSGRLVKKPTITHADVISFMQRANAMLDKRDFKLNEELQYQSVGQVFDTMIDEALDPTKRLPY